MPSLFVPADVEALLRRVALLELGAERRWGKMTAAQAVCHMIDQLEVAMGAPCEAVAAPWIVRNVLRVPLIRWLPWPKGKIQTVPEMLATDPGEFAADQARLAELAAAFADRVGPGDRRPHPAFGMLSGDLWAVLSARHLDHHLTQFGA